MKYPDEHVIEGGKRGRAAARSFRGLSDMGQMGFAVAFAEMMGEVGSDKEAECGHLSDVVSVLRQLSLLQGVLAAEFARVRADYPIVP